MEQLPCNDLYGPLLGHLLGIVPSTFTTVFKKPINHGINTDQLPINGSRICIGHPPHLNVKVDEGIMIVRLNSESHHTLLQGGFLWKIGSYLRSPIKRKKQQHVSLPRH